MKLLVKLEKNPNVNIVNQIFDYLNPTQIYVPIFDKTTFKMNDYVYKNTFFGKYILSVSGNITGSKKILLNNRYVPALKITNDFKENVEFKKRKKKFNTKEELINILKSFSLEKIANKLEAKSNINKLIISSIDEEIYSLKEFMILSNFYNEILDTIEVLLKTFSLKEALIATKNTDFLSIKNVKSIIGTYPNIKINLLPDKYLIGNDKFLCNYLNESENNTLILSTSDIYDIYNTVIKGKYITENMITISGDALLKSLVINTKIGVSLKDLIKNFITITDDNYDVYINGYLTGNKIENINDIIITKDIDSIVINKRKEEEETSCINCGACMQICPVNINVKHCYFNKLNSKKCLGCGLCNYICPAKLKLKEIIKSDNNENENN